MSGPLFVFAGGGTGGHVFPGIALAGSLKKRSPDARFLFAGSGRTVEQAILAEAGFEALPLRVPPVASAYRKPLRFLRGHFSDWSQARRLIDEESPAAVIGLGGLASFAVSHAAGRRHVPVILLEQNVIPGRATRRLARRFTVCSSFDETAEYLPGARRVIFTGNPLRPEITQQAEASPEEISRRNTLLILGGSQGSRRVNDAVLEAARQIVSNSTARVFHNWKVIHQTGPDEAESASAAWNDLGMTAWVQPFFSDLPEQYSRASLVVSRSGATTLAELACLGLPSILLPYEHARDDHQTANAAVFQDAGAAHMIDTRSPSLVTQLAESLGTLMAEPRKRVAMTQCCGKLARPEAAIAVAEIVCREADLR